MSYDLYLVDPITKEELELETPHHMRGGTYAIGGIKKLHLNITYNYSLHYYRVFGGDDTPESARGIRTIYGLSGAESIPLLEAAIGQLGDDVDSDYWAATEGNAKRALLHLKALASLRPDGVWRGD